MSNFRDALFNAGKNATCQVINSPTFGASAGIGLGAEASAILLGPQIGYIYCDREDITPPPAPPFEGGQCRARYEVNFSGTAPTGITGGGVCSGSQNYSTSAILWGPISSFALGQALCSGGPGGGGRQIEFTAFSNLSGPDLGQPFNGVIGGARYTLNIGAITRIDGMADNCGDPDPIIPPFPPGGVTNNFDITYETNEGNTINLSVPITVFKPFIDFSGNFSVPLSFNVGGVNFNGTLKPFGDPEFTFNFPTTGGPGTTDGTEQPNPVDPSDPFEPADEESPSTIIGVEVFSEVSAAAPASSIIFNNAPNIFAPRLGSVSFCIRTPSSLVWTEDLDIKNVETYIPCPAPQGAVAVRATANPGVTVRWNAIRSRPLLQIS